MIEGANARDFCLEKWWLETFTDPRGDIQETDHAMAASKTCIPDTNITEPSAHINLEAYRVRDASATRVIAQFLEVKLTINDNLLAGNGFSTLQIIESAFLNKAIRIDSVPAVNASHDARNRSLKSIWGHRTGPPIHFLLPQPLPRKSLH